MYQIKTSFMKCLNINERFDFKCLELNYCILSTIRKDKLSSDQYVTLNRFYYEIINNQSRIKYWYRKTINII